MAGVINRLRLLDCHVEVPHGFRAGNTRKELKQMARGPQWREAGNISPSRGYVCGHCTHKVSSGRGFSKVGTNGETIHAQLVICTHCDKPTYFEGDMQLPGIKYGEHVESLPQNIGKLYDESRNCMQCGAYTASAMVTRKLLMNIAHSQGAKEGESFQFYVNYLADHGFVPPKAKPWVDVLRKKGNEATHEIPDVSREDAQDVISFAGMILKMVFDYPARVPTPSP